MWGKLAGILIILFIIVGLFVPLDSIGVSSNSSNTAITYGIATYNNDDYKNTVDTYFEENGNVNLNNANETIITASDVNEISGNISSRTYNDDQVLSCALVDLSSNNDLTVDVDESKITTVTEEMYISALNSSGITQGHVIVTSPTTATGESALAGIMESYETATGVEIPSEVKDAANNEIYTQSEVVNNSNATADEVADLVSEAKDQVSQENTTDNQTIISIVTNIASNNNINISDDDINNIANSISESQSVQDQASDYQSQISDYVSSEGSQTLFESLWNTIQSFINSITGVTDSLSSNSSNNSSNSSNNTSNTSY
ncbi:MAG: DUF1002 domain-containing protein [Methanosphaera sp.]|nr:DUF1002 domain-containing protein [Methanosphaera sp.]